MAAIPYVGEFLQLGDLGRLILEARVPNAFVKPDLFLDSVRQHKMLSYWHLNKEGFTKSFLSSIRNFKLTELGHAYEKGMEISLKFQVF